VTGAHASDLRAQQRRRAIRNLRRTSVDALLRLAQRTGGKPGGLGELHTRALDTALLHP
jgi:hypothetical protein